ncbi:MAG: hypothetical protein A2Y16_05540 [Tenericutes bacterium GWF2_57_13]|nr:MAG: hypothetical protein A2Y16_05540 [Tenericutes bacterium GWF2_57_13]
MEQQLEYKLVPNLKAIKTAMFEQGVTHSELGVLLHLSTVSVYSRLAGKTRFYLDELFDVSQAVGKDMMSLVSIVPTDAPHSL